MAFISGPMLANEETVDVDVAHMETSTLVSGISRPKRMPIRTLQEKLCIQACLF